MTSKMRFGEQVQASHATRLRKLMPQGFADDAKSQLIYDFFADTTNCFDIAKKVCGTAFCVYQPLSANVHDYCLRNSNDKR
jgi:hypothetical protein